MPIARTALDTLARNYVEGMTSIRGRRVHRLLMREFASFDHVLPARTGDSAPALLALGHDGRVAVCCTDGRGPAADIVRCASLAGAAVSTSYDLLKDSLPIVRWTIRHPAVGVLTIAINDVQLGDVARIGAIFGVGSST